MSTRTGKRGLLGFWSKIADNVMRLGINYWMYMVAWKWWMYIYIYGGWPGNDLNIYGDWPGRGLSWGRPSSPRELSRMCRPILFKVCYDNQIYTNLLLILFSSVGTGSLLLMLSCCCCCCCCYHYIWDHHLLLLLLLLLFLATCTIWSPIPITAPSKWRPVTAESANAGA